MPKKPNPKKLAAAAIRQSDALEAAVAGSYEVGKLTHNLGKSQFTIAFSARKSDTRVVSITSALLRTRCCRVVAGQHFLIVDGTEVVGVANTSAAIRALEEAGRLPSDLPTGLSEFFNMEEPESDQEEDPWAGIGQKSRKAAGTAESLAQAAQYESAYRQKRKGVLARGARVGLDAEGDAEVPDFFGAEDAEEAVAPPSAEEVAAAAAAAHEARKSRESTSLRKRRQELMERIRLGMAATRIQRLVRPRYAALLAARRAAEAEELRQEEEEERARVYLAELSRASAGKSWEEVADEI